MQDFKDNPRLPERLDLNDWIQLCLDSESELDRQIALEELSVTGIPPYLAAKIREMSATDESASCRSLALWVCGLEQARSELRPQIKKLELSPVNVLMLLEDAVPASTFVFVQMLRRAPNAEILEQWRSGLVTETNSLMQQIGLKILAKFGQPQDAALAMRFLQNDDAEVVCASFSLLHSQDTELFKENISAGLKSRSFKVQLHAVHLLRSIDEKEAIKYTGSFLFNRNPLVRQRALRELMLFPFKKVERLFLQFLSREVQSLLLVKAGFVVAFNPSADLPIKIFEVYQLARDSKKHILQLILRQLVEAIQSAKILDQNFDDYMNDLKEKINLKRSEMVIRCAVKDLNSDNSHLRLSAVDRLSGYQEYPSIQKVLTEHLKNETNKEICHAIESLLLAGAPPKETSQENPQETPKKKLPESANDLQEFLDLEPRAQKRWLKKIRSDEDWHKSRALLLKILPQNLHKSVLLELIMLFARFGSRIDSAPLLTYLENSDPSLVAATIKALGTTDLDVILPHLNRFLADDDPRIKSAALEVFIVADKEAAIQYIDSILKSASSANRRIGLSLLPQIDYASAEPLLWKRLKYETNSELRLQACYMIAANPTQEGIVKLFAVTHKQNGELERTYEEIWQMALVSAESQFSLPGIEIEKDCWEAFKADIEQPPQESSPYAYNKVVGESETSDSRPEKELTMLELLYLHLQEFKLLYIGGLLIMIPIYFLTSQTGEKTSVKNYKRRVSNLKGAKFVKHERTPSTQVGGEGWQGTLKSGARDVLSGQAYKAVLQTAQRECNDIRRDYERNLQQYYTDLANNPNQPEELVHMAEAQLNPSFSRAMTAWDSGNRSEAEIYLEKAVEDPRLNTVGKCMALQKLVEISEERQDKKMWIKWHDELFKQMKNMPGYENLKGFDNFSDTFKYLQKMRQYMSDGGDSSIIMQHLKAHGESDASARESLESLDRIGEIFPEKSNF